MSGTEIMIEGKVSLGPYEVAYPMPVSVLGTVVEGRPSFMALAWVARVNAKPPMMAAAVGRNHVSHGAIKEAGCFSINFTSQDQRVETDYVGISTARKTSKSGVFQIFHGKLAGAPMIRSAPVSMECKLVHELDLPSNTLFVGEVVSAWADESVVEDGKVDLARSRPLVLSMTDTRYWSLAAEPVGSAWRDGKEYGGG